MCLTRHAGTREPRWAHLLAGQPEAGAEEAAPLAAPPSHQPAPDRIAVLEREMADLRREFEDFRKRFE
jgi:uncharacterized protein YceH (UPF0502 family)